MVVVVGGKVVDVVDVVVVVAGSVMTDTVGSEDGVGSSVNEVEVGSAALDAEQLDKTRVKAATSTTDRRGRTISVLSRSLATTSARLADNSKTVRKSLGHSGRAPRRELRTGVRARAGKPRIPLRRHVRRRHTARGAVGWTTSTTTVCRESP
jgi:hypothetical protein